MRMIDGLLQELQMESASTRRVLERVPEDKLSWRPHEKSYSLGELALHVASTPMAAARLVSVDTLEAPQFTQSAATSQKQLLEELDKQVTGVKELLGGMDDARMMASWKLTRGGETVMEAPRVGMIRMVMLNHWYHHRGQLTVYLRLLGVPVPAVYGPSADENPFMK